MAAPNHDFADAQRRHWKDATVLFACERWANADYLYGLSAECGLKTIMVGEGMPVDETGKPRYREHRKHIHELWPIFREFIAGLGERTYLRQLPSDKPFADWSHHDRYASRECFDRNRVDLHRKATRRIDNMVQLYKESKR